MLGSIDHAKLGSWGIVMLGNLYWHGKCMEQIPCQDWGIGN